MLYDKSKHLSKFKERGWELSMYDECGCGHDEPIFVNGRFPGIVLRVTCMGQIELEVGMVDDGVCRTLFIEGGI